MCRARRQLAGLVWKICLGPITIPLLFCLFSIHFKLARSRARSPVVTGETMQKRMNSKLDARECDVVARRRRRRNGRAWNGTLCDLTTRGWKWHNWESGTFPWWRQVFFSVSSRYSFWFTPRDAWKTESIKTFLYILDNIIELELQHSSIFEIYVIKSIFNFILCTLYVSTDFLW